MKPPLIKSPSHHSCHFSRKTANHHINMIRTSRLLLLAIAAIIAVQATYLSSAANVQQARQAQSNQSTLHLNDVTSATTNNPTNPQQPQNLLGGKYVKLDNTNGTRSKLLPYDHNTQSSLNKNANSLPNTQPQFSSSTSSDLNNNNNNKSPTSDTNSKQMRESYDKICIGTSNRMSGQHNKTDHYQNLAERYRNCTYVIGNLEITWLERARDGRQLDLSFLDSIREITGYLLIAYVDVDKISMPNLQIIRGRDLFVLNNGEREEFAMFLIENDLKMLELPNLREILTGSVGSYNNRNLCYLSKSVNWDEILNVEQARAVFRFNGTEPVCPPCHDSCQSGCWGPGPEMCQKHSKTNCSPQCAQGRCFGSEPRECCHLFCAGGCTGPKQSDCIACKNFYDDGECIQECPPIQKYNSNKYLWETDPKGKYAFGSTCVKECPDHLLRDNNACVRTCPPTKRSVNGECIPCAGPCPKNCQGVEVVNSGNIGQFVNCTVIEGSLTILDTTFNGYSEVHSNGTIGSRYAPMKPDRLEVFKTLREITGYLNIQASHDEFKNLSYFKNLKTINGRQTTDLFYALSIIKTSLTSLGLKSLTKVRSGKITIEENKDLCLVDQMDWNALNLAKPELITIRNNANANKCHNSGLRCNKQCAKSGCWGPGPDECLACVNYRLEDYCVDKCSSSLESVGWLSFDAGNQTCKRCHSECRGGCKGTEANHCWHCKNVRDGPYCVNECPKHKFNNNGICEECDKSCLNGCTGPSNKLGEGGCNACSKTLISSSQPFVASCIRSEDACPDGFYQEYLGPHNFFQQHYQPHHSSQAHHQEFSNGSHQAISSGSLVCRRCHHRCKACTGMGTHTTVCECAKYVVADQCDDQCPRDYYADEHNNCLKCSSECNGCFGPTESDCLACRVYRIYSSDSPASPITSSDIGNSIASAQTSMTAYSLRVSSSSPASYNVDHQHLPKPRPQSKFNCTSVCPPDKPYRISDSNMLDPFCSESPGIDETSRSLSFGISVILMCIFVTIAIVVCVLIHRSQIQKNKAVKLAIMMIGNNDNDEPSCKSDVKPNLSSLRSIKETELRRGEKIGEGIGGIVYKGLWFPEFESEFQEPGAFGFGLNNANTNTMFNGNNTTKSLANMKDGKNYKAVAIKVLHSNSQSGLNKEFLDEAYIMASVDHPNLVKLLAVCMTPNELMLITTLMPLGCLLEYVRKNKQFIIDHPCGSKKLLEWSKQIAEGMAYLEDRRMVHRDLALRNVLLQKFNKAVISDFGLAKFLDSDQTEYNSTGGRLPIKWLAPECIQHRKFTHKSDVWAFGVTIWELMTFGEKPFEEYEPKHVPEEIEKGARLKKPAALSTDIYKVMLSCWFFHPEARPDFKSLAEDFGKFVKNPNSYPACASKDVLNSQSDHTNTMSSNPLINSLQQNGIFSNLLANRRRRAMSTSCADNNGNINNHCGSNDSDENASDYQDWSLGGDENGYLMRQHLVANHHHHHHHHHNVHTMGNNHKFNMNDPSSNGATTTNMPMSAGYELRHHSESDTGIGLGGSQILQHLTMIPSTSSTSSNANNPNANNKKLDMMHNGRQQQPRSEEDVFEAPNLSQLATTNFGSRRSPNGTVTTTLSSTNTSSTLINSADFNNNFSMSNGRLTNPDSCFSSHQTVSSNSLGQRSDLLRTDQDDYLEPTPPFSKENKFNFCTSDAGGSKSKHHQQPSVSRDPPHSAGLIGIISNAEYFMPVNQNRHTMAASHSGTNASSGNIPHSLV